MVSVLIYLLYHVLFPSCQEEEPLPDYAALARIIMAPLIVLLLLASSLTPSVYAHFQPNDEAFIALSISQNGLDFVKDLLVNKAISSVIPLRLPDIEKSVKIPVLGNVYMMLSNITIYQIDVPKSNIQLGGDGVSIVASGATCNLSIHWYYSYSTWLVPIKVSDEGSASVQVEDMEIGLTLGLENLEGSLKLVLKDIGCNIKDISIKLDGGASWLYQGDLKKHNSISDIVQRRMLGIPSTFLALVVELFPASKCCTCIPPNSIMMVDAFEGQITSRVENAITKKLNNGISKLDSFFQNLPKEIPVNDNASLNVTFSGDPLLSKSSIEFEINGLFIARSVEVPNYWHKNPKLSVSCTNSSQMLGIALDEAVFNSASSLFYDAKFMHWVVDKVPDQSLLNTAGWRFVIPQLYKKYPNHDMNLNISLSTPPIVKISNHKADVNILVDLTIDVKEGDEVIPVACISLVIKASGSVKINGNNLAGTIELDDFAMSLKWSNIGNMRMYLIQVPFCFA
ncbi:putative BPI/LBP family protein [Senna tora]|uniref:Putative BPI/LBP family protein n=1 Tax=Senna tora TaxID=362788 RepID=A0A834U0B0_9FABA|nr:putative BPI/LBP family protein [Senna tora]